MKEKGIVYGDREPRCCYEVLVVVSKKERLSLPSHTCCVESKALLVKHELNSIAEMLS